jgi:membrane protein DedA with SNARE-associated domain
MEQELLDLAHGFRAHAEAAMPLLRHYGYAGIFVATLVEGFGIPAPGQTLLTVGALAAGHGDLNIIAVILVAWSATVLGNVIGYVLGRRAGRRLLLRTGVHRSRIRRVERFVRRYGPAIIVVARFVDGLRQVSSIVAGSMKMPWHAFLISIVIGATLWAGAIGLGAYYLERDFHVVAGLFLRLRPYAWLIAGGALLALLAWVTRRRPAGRRSEDETS